MNYDTSGIEILDIDKTSSSSVNDKSTTAQTSKNKTTGKKRKLSLTEPVLPIKRPRRSLMSEFLTKNESKPSKSAKQPEASDDDTDDGEKKDGEFEVEKILDYNRVKVSL